MKKVAMYIDGFNFYYALKNGLPDEPIGLGWCDFRKLFDKYMRQDGETLDQIKYFTAPVRRFAHNGEKRRQDLWLSAVKSIENLKVIEGEFKEKEIVVNGIRKKVRREKMTDVNIAVELLIDVMDLKVCQKAIVVSADLDFHPAAHAVVNSINNRGEVEFWFPPGSKTQDLKKYCATSRIKCHQITQSMLFECRLPDVIKRNGETISIDPAWRMSKEVIRRHKDLLYGENATEMPARAETL